MSNLFAHPADVGRAAEYGLAMVLHIDWGPIGNPTLTAVTAELRASGRALDALILQHVKPGPRPTERTATSLAENRGLNRAGVSPSTK